MSLLDITRIEYCPPNYGCIPEPCEKTLNAKDRVFSPHLENQDSAGSNAGGHLLYVRTLKSVLENLFGNVGHCTIGKALL